MPLPANSSTVREVLVEVRRRWRGLALWLCVCISGAIAYVSLTKPEFVATTQVVLEPRQFEAPFGTAAAPIAPTLDSSQVDSQLHVIQSERNLRYVFDTLGLANDPDFAEEGFPVAWLTARLRINRDTTSLSTEDLARRTRQSAYLRFAGRVSVQRLGESYAIEVSYRALSPQKAAKLANSITAAYIRDQIIYNAAAEAADRGGEYLQNRIANLETEEKVADYAVKTGVIPNYTFGHASARVVSAAIEPLTKSYPMTNRILGLSVVAGLVTGVGAIAFHSELDRKIRSPQQLRRLTGIDVFATVPKVAKRGGLPLNETINEPASPFARSMLALCNMALTSAAGSQAVSVGVVSCNAHEGRSSLAANLAYLIAASGLPVTLVDADLRNPALTQALAPKAISSPSKLALPQGVDATGLRVAINSLLSFVPAVSISGGENDSGLVFSCRETVLAIKALAATGDVIVDLPPLSTSANAFALGKSLTGVIVVATLHKTTVDELASAIRTMNTLGIRLLGVILNEPPPKRKRCNAGDVVR